MSTSTVHHVHISIAPLLALPAAEFDELCDGTLSGDDGQSLSAADARQALEALVAKGQLIVPPAGCDHWDPKTGCLGHAKEEIKGHFQRQAMTLSNKLTCQEAVTLDEAAYQDGFADARRLAVTLTAQADARIAALEAALAELVEEAESYCRSTGHKEEGAAMFGACDAICAAAAKGRAVLSGEVKV